MGVADAVGVGDANVGRGRTYTPRTTLDTHLLPLGPLVLKYMHELVSDWYDVSESRRKITSNEE